MSKGIFESDDILFGLARLILNFDLKIGSSKQGNALLASVGENCVLSTVLQKIIFISFSVYHINIITISFSFDYQNI